MALIPTKAEAASLKFVFLSRLPLVPRYLIAGLILLLGALLWLLTSFPVIALVPLFFGHFLLWVRRQKLAPGGATPAHEEVWTPTDDDWCDQVERLEKAGAAWDVSPFDISNGRGCLTFGLVGLGVAALIAISSTWSGYYTWRFVGLAVLLFVPMWFNGMRSNWVPSELRIKGQALSVARAVAEELAGDRYEPVPLLALREGKKGHYPVDARLMLRPKSSLKAARGDAGKAVDKAAGTDAGKADDRAAGAVAGKAVDNVAGADAEKSVPLEAGTGSSSPTAEDLFLGIQVQVALNNVMGRDYPYLYCVILSKDKGRLPRLKKKLEHLVYENGEGDGVKYLVIRQFADRKGGWHTPDGTIELIMTEALKLADSCV